MTPLNPAQLRKTAEVFLLCTGLLLAVATGRMILDGRAQMTEAQRHLTSGDREASVSALENVVKAYVPGSPYPGRALRELAILAKSAEMRGDQARAAFIFEVSRRSILSTRHIFQPFGEELAQAEKEIVRLRQPSQAAGNLKVNLVQRPLDPSPIASIGLFLGLLCWIGGAVMLCLENLKPVAWVACLGGLAVWVLMAWIAS